MASRRSPRSSGKTLLVVGTGPQSERYIFQRLAKIGHEILVLNRERNWAHPYVQEWILADTLNTQEALEAVRSYITSTPKRHIDGALTFREEEVPLLARICAELKLPRNSVESATLTRDKGKMQERFAQCGLPYIRSQTVKSKVDLERAIESIGFPAVLKPVAGAWGQFVTLVRDCEEAEEAYALLLRACTPAFNPLYRTRRYFLYQEHIEGQEFSIECACQHGVPHDIGILERTTMEKDFFVQRGGICPPRVSDELQWELLEAAKAAIIVLGLQNSLAHVEAIAGKEGIRVIDVSARIGDDYLYEGVRRAYRYDLIQAASEISMGINLTQHSRDTLLHVVSRYFIPETSGIVTKIRGVPQARRRPSTAEVYLSKGVGDSVLVPPDGFETIGWITVQGKSLVAAEHALESTLDTIAIDVTPFRSTSSVGKTQRKRRSSIATINLQQARGVAKIEKLRLLPLKELRSLHVGIACNIYDESAPPEEQDLTETGRSVERALRDRGYKVSLFDFNDPLGAMQAIAESNVDIVFNLCERIHGTSVLEPHAAAMLDVLQIPYTGSHPFALELGSNKIRTKMLLMHHNIPTPKWDYALSLDDPINTDLRYPLMIKPANTHNSIGVTNDSVASDKRELKRQLAYVIEELGCPALVEEYIEGDEYDATIIGSEEDDVKVLPLTRSIFRNMPRGYWHIYSYDLKWANKKLRDSIVVQQPPKIGKKLESLLTEIALDTFNILDCHDYGRVELRTDRDGNPYVLELNPNPTLKYGDFTQESAELVGLDHGDLLEEIMRLAIRRYKGRPAYYHLRTTAF